MIKAPGIRKNEPQTGWHNYNVIPCYLEVENVSMPKLHHENAVLMFNKRVTNNILKRF